MNTYRWREHCGPNFDNHIGYRSQKEFEIWKKKCPLDNIKNKILKKDIKLAKLIDKIDFEINKDLDKIFEHSKRANLPKLNSASKFVYV